MAGFVGSNARKRRRNIVFSIAFIILIDTFKYPISKIVPNIEFILYNLYESIKDIRLFFNDLI